jgi:hypothetical protein
MTYSKSPALRAGLALLAAIAFAPDALAQHHRFELRCMVEGATANVIDDNKLDTPARAQYLNGQRTIAVSPKLTEDLPAVVQTFLVAHECGHLIASPTLSAAYHQRLNPDRERVADRIGIRLLRDQLKFTLEQAKTVAAAFRDTKASLPEYLPGPEREKWILACFKTDTPNCSQ